MIDLIIFILVISIIVIFHEFGHFVAAKISKIPVLEFAVGFGPAIYKRKVGETVYRINWFLFGGYVNLLGEGEFEDDKNPNSFENQSSLKRMFVALNGVFMNLVFAAIVFTIYLSITSFKTYIINLSDIHFPFGTQTNVIGLQAVDTSAPAYKTLGILLCIRFN